MVQRATVFEMKAALAESFGHELLVKKFGERHLHRYVAEFDFRYSNRIALGVDDTERSRRAVKGAEGKRLKYQGPSAPQSA